MLVCYDVNTTEKAGRKRLYRMAKLCEKYGQRVQHSVFECTVSELELEEFKINVEKLIDWDFDSLRIYKLYGNREDLVEVLGQDRYIDYDEPMII
jgi:CRISPR-associated protein Cas2